MAGELTERTRKRRKNTVLTITTTYRCWTTAWREELVLLVKLPVLTPSPQHPSTRQEKKRRRTKGKKKKKRKEKKGYSIYYIYACTINPFYNFAPTPTYSPTSRTRIEYIYTHTRTRETRTRTMALFTTHGRTWRHVWDSDIAWTSVRT